MSLLANLNVEQLEKITIESELLMWGIEGEFHYINTRNFVLRVNVREMEQNEDAWELHDSLGSIFKNRPNIGQTLVYQHGIIEEGKHHAKELAEKYMTSVPKTSGVVTQFIYAKGMWRNRWIKFDEFNLFVNDDFISLLYKPEKIKAYASGVNDPLYLCDGDFMILPLKNMADEVDTKEIDVLAEII